MPARGRKGLESRRKATGPQVGSLMADCLFRFFRAQVRPPSGSGLPLPVAQVRPRCVRGVPVSRPRSCRSRALVSRSSCAGPFPLILYNKVYSFPLPRPFRCPCRFFNPLYFSRLRLASGNFFKKVPHLFCPFPASVYFCTRFRERRRRCFERFSPFFGLGPEKKLPWKFGSVAVNSYLCSRFSPFRGAR